MIESVRRPRGRRQEPRVPARHLPAAQPLHGRQHVLRLRLHRVRDARRARHGRAVHRHRDRARHARRPHRAADRTRPARSAWSSTRSPTSSRSASRRRSSRSRGDSRSSGASAGRRDSSIVERRRDAAGALQHPDRPRSSTSGTSSACRRRPRRASSRPRCIAWPVSRRRGVSAVAAAVDASMLVPAALMVSTHPLPQFQDDQLRLGPVVPAAAGVRRCSSRSSRPSRAFTLLVLAYGYLLVGLHRDWSSTRLRARRDGAATGSVTVTRRALPGRARRAPSSRRTVSMLRRRWPVRGPSPPVFVEKYGSNARRDGLRVHADARVGERQSRSSRRRRDAP